MNIRNRNVILSVILLSVNIVLTIGCNTAFIVSKDKIIRQNMGYLVFRPGDDGGYAEFIPCTITNMLKMDIAHAILSKETTTGFCLYNIPEKDVIFLEKFDDSSIKQKMHIDAIVKVRLTYYKRKQKVSGLKKTSNQVVEHKMNINNRDFSYLLTEGLNYYYISASPITN